ncbi:MAG: hypothetical protein ABJ356_12855, partial [Balneola sp.]
MRNLTRCFVWSIFPIALFISCIQPTYSPPEEAKELLKLWNHQYVVAGVPSAAPLVLDSDLIIITGAKNLIALNHETGSAIWEGEIEGEGALQGRRFLDNNQMIVSVHNNHLVAWDKNSGDLLINDGYSLYELGRNNILKENFLMVGDT